MPELLQDWVTLQASLHPDAPAVVGETDVLSYWRLERLSNQIARSLRAHGCRRGDRVCLLMPKSPTAIACIVGIYKADCIYVPLDPTSPSPRLETMIGACGSRWILAGGPVAPLLDQILDGERPPGSMAVGWVEEEPILPVRPSDGFGLEEVLDQPPTALPSRSRSGDAAHILFPSGSTGTPKGVVVTHG